MLLRRRYGAIWLLVMAVAGPALAAPKVTHEVRAGAHITHRGLYTTPDNLPSQGRMRLRSTRGYISPYASDRAGLVNTGDGVSIRSYFRRSSPAITVGGGGQAPAPQDGPP